MSSGATKRSRSGGRRSIITYKRPRGCPLACPVELWNHLVAKGVWGEAQQAAAGVGPWEVRAYQGPSEVLIGTEQYVHMQRQYQRNEKRRIQLRLREIERFLQDKPWDGPAPTAAETEWARFVQAEREARRRKTKEITVGIRTVKVEPEPEDDRMVPDLVWQDPYLAHTQMMEPEENAAMSPLLL